jgi:GH43 family beta-xylosidase
MTKLELPRPVPGQDPWVVPMEGAWHYLLVLSSGGSRIVGWEFEGSRFIREYVLWQPPRRSDYGRQVWAPELHKINGTYYIYFAAGHNANHRIYALKSDSLTGPYGFVGKVRDPEHDVWAIDLTVFPHDGLMYAVWSGWDNANSPFPQRLYIAPMSDPVTISGPRHMLTQPTLDWEMSCAKVVEGPQLFRTSNGQLAMLYAADASWTPAYKTGVMFWTGGPIMAASSWIKRDQPLLTNGGHGCVVTLGGQKYLVHHRKTTEHPGWADREVCWIPLQVDSSSPMLVATKAAA